MADATSHSQKVDGLEKLDIGQLEKELGTTPETGLTLAEAQTRLAQYGANEIAEKTTSPILKFLSYFWGPIPWMIEAAAVLSGVVRHWTDLGIILALLIVNAVVGFWEEYQAGNAIAALKARLAPHARVKRGGAWSDMAAQDLVPGDIVRLRLGDIVPAVRGRSARMLSKSIKPRSPANRFRSPRSEGEVLYSGAILRQGGGRHRLCDGRQDLLRQDRGARGRGAYDEPFPKGRDEDRRLPDHCRNRTRHRSSSRWRRSGRRDHNHAASRWCSRWRPSPSPCPRFCP